MVCSFSYYSIKGARAQKIGLKSTYFMNISYVRVSAKKCDVKWLTLNFLLST